jgi:DNA helicase-2/ATP-dependent DNA helicase PcrA
MRLPRVTQLTEDQKSIYLYAPTDKHILVHGPPGTGKTLIACLRAIELQKRKVPVVLGMFNRVLSKYSANVADGQAMPSQTVLMWFRNWWKKCGLPPHPATTGGIVIQSTYGQNDQLKAVGARWNPNEWRPWGGGRAGAWIIDAEKYFAEPERFRNWTLWHEPPSVDDDSYQIDWSEVAKHIMNHDSVIPDDMLNLGTLLVDEGQDFAPGFYKMLRQISALSADPGRKVAHPLRCFVLADENQQLTEQNSTLQQIAEALKIAESNRYLLLDNFRNSKEIAELARHFFADVGVLPRLPVRSSATPSYAAVGNQTDIVDRIKIWLTNNPGKEVGVLAFTDDARHSLAAALKLICEEMRGRKITVQTYSWKSRQENKVDNLLFDKQDVVTVLNTQSCKGLEFDAVFVVNLHEAQIGIYGPDRFKMQMFVAVSRARDWVSLLDSGPRAQTGTYYECLPGPEFLERENIAEASKPRKLSAKPVAPPASGEVSDWESELLKLAKKRDFSINDRRSKGGAVWVNGGNELARLLEPLGFAYSAKREGWWRK